MRRVVITGTGAISALGRNTSEFAESLRLGRCGIGPIESADVSQIRFQNGAEVKQYSHQPYFDDRRADFMDRFAQFAVIAAREAATAAASDPSRARTFRRSGFRMARRSSSIRTSLILMTAAPISWTASRSLRSSRPAKPRPLRHRTHRERGRFADPVSEWRGGQAVFAPALF